MGVFPDIGEVFEDRYRLESVVGEGGFARVFRATDLTERRAVAIKILRSNFTTQEKANEAAKRFKREAKVVSKLTSPHTIRVHEYGVSQSGLMYMVTELIGGTHLAEIINREGALAPERVCRIVTQILRSLKEAHDAGILHRDIKPANVMVYDGEDEADLVKVLDFGIAKVYQPDAADGSSTMNAALTAGNRVVGSIGYIAPERLFGTEEPGPPSDLYCVGVIALESLIGRSAFDPQDIISSTSLDDLERRVPGDVDCDDELREVIDCLLRPRTEDRYARADEPLAVLDPPRGNRIWFGVVAALVLFALIAGAFVLV